MMIFLMRDFLQFVVLKLMSKGLEVRRGTFLVHLEIIMAKLTLGPIVSKSLVSLIHSFTPFIIFNLKAILKA